MNNVGIYKVKWMDKGDFIELIHIEHSGKRRCCLLLQMNFCGMNNVIKRVTLTIIIIITIPITINMIRIMSIDIIDF